MDFSAKGILLKAIGVLPVKFLLGLVLDLVESFTKKTENKVDDKIVEFLRAVINSVEFDSNGIQITKNNRHLFGDIKFQDAIKWLLDGLRKAAKSTKTEVDDTIVEAVEESLRHWNIIK